MGREAGGKECEELSLRGKFLCFDICQHVTHFCGKASQEQFVFVLFIFFFLNVRVLIYFLLFLLVLVLCAFEHSHAHKCRYKCFIEL